MSLAIQCVQNNQEDRQ